MTRFTCIHFYGIDKKRERNGFCYNGNVFASSNDLIGIITKLIMTKSMLFFFSLYSFSSFLCIANLLIFGPDLNLVLIDLKKIYGIHIHLVGKIEI